MTIVLGLDLSLTCSGAVVVDTKAVSPWDVLARSDIKPTGRRSGETDWQWNIRRFDHFSKALLGMLNTHRPSLLVVEVTKQGFFTGGHTPGREFKAGRGLGMALGWLQATMSLAGAYGVSCPVSEVTGSESKRAVTGNRMATKGGVRGFLGEKLGIDLTTWSEDQVDGLAAIYAHSKSLAPSKLPKDEIAHGTRASASRSTDKSSTSKTPKTPKTPTAPKTSQRSSPSSSRSRVPRRRSA